MTPFEYVCVLISIILGLGITVLLTGLADLLRHWRTTAVYWPYLVWIAIVFVLHLQEWWITYSLRSEMEWTLPLFLFIISYPIVLFVLANLLFPKWTDKKIDLEDHYFDNYQQYFGVALVLIIISILQNHFLLGLAFGKQILQFALAALFVALLWSRARHHRVHAMVAVLMLFLMIVSFIIVPEHLLLK
jgi:hypothetical protein